MNAYTDKIYCISDGREKGWIVVKHRFKFGGGGGGFVQCIDYSCRVQDVILYMHELMYIFFLPSAFTTHVGPSIPLHYAHIHLSASVGLSCLPLLLLGKFLGEIRLHRQPTRHCLGRWPLGLFPIQSCG